MSPNDGCCGDGGLSALEFSFESKRQPESKAEIICPILQIKMPLNPQASAPTCILSSREPSIMATMAFLKAGGGLMHDPSGKTHREQSASLLPQSSFSRRILVAFQILTSENEVWPGRDHQTSQYENKIQKCS